MTLSAGDLDRRIELEVATPVADAANDQVLEWAHAFNRWAMKKDQFSREAVNAQQIVRDFDTVFAVRYDSQSRKIAPESYRVRYRDSIYEIVGITEGADRLDSLNILCASRPDIAGARGRDEASEGAP